MPDLAKIIPLTEQKYDEYIALGKKSYLQHYLHFWSDGDPSPYINESFTKEVLRTAHKNKNAKYFIIYSKAIPVGIIKIVLNQEVGNSSKEESLLLEKIYILKEYSGKGIGTKVLTFVEDFARKHNKKIVWLDTMVKGSATAFYLKNGYKIQSTKYLDYENIVDTKREMYIMSKKLF
jgi:GNAT superfamily N-acetyltransferase